MVDKQIPLKAVPVLHALARAHGAMSFGALRDASGLQQATLNRILNELCTHAYALKVGHGRYLAGPALLDMGLALTRNQIIHGFMPLLSALRDATQLNAELYVITPGGPIFLTHSPAQGEVSISFRFGHVIQNRTAHPAALYYLAQCKSQKVTGYRENFIVDRGGQWPELFRAASMVVDSHYCLGISGMLKSVGAERHMELKRALQTICNEVATQRNNKEIP